MNPQRQSNRLPGLRAARQLAWTALAFLFVQAAAISSAFATDYTVTKTTDTNDGLCDSLDCSLREAIITANANAGADRILLGSGLLYALSIGPFDGSGALIPGAGDFDITGPLTIEGNGSTVDGGGIDRVFDVHGVIAVTINNLTIRNGTAKGFLSLGGGLNIRGGSVVLNNSTVTANSTAVESGERDDGGGIAVVGSFNPVTGTATLASLSLNNSTVSNNTASNGGGIVCVLCALTIANSTIAGNTANLGDGGGIQLTGNSSTGSVTSSTMTLNTVSGGGARGGALSVPVGTSTSTLSRTRIVSNTGTTGSGVFNIFATITATNNWWGCNFGPGAGGAGCASTPNSVAGAVTTSPFLVLKSSASPTSVLPGGSSTMTADLTFNSVDTDTTAGGTIPNGTLVTFSGTLGTFAAPSSPITNGKTADVYTASAVAGTAILNASFDGQTVSPAVLVGTPPATGTRVRNDFNHDGLSDLGVFRPSLGRFLIAGMPGTDWGAAGDLPVAGDFDGDGNPDVAVFRPANGTWYIAGGATIVWGAAGDIPVPGDYDGDGTTDIAVFRPSTGMFYIRNGASVAWGLSGDLPVVGDYDGDGRADIAVYRPATGTWYIRNIASVVYGFAADIPVPADYNGDGLIDIAVFRPSTGTWFIKDQYTQVWGASGDVPVPLDRDGDGRAELGVFRRATGIWYFKNHLTDTSETVPLGLSGDIPLNRAMPPVQTRFGDYDGDRKADLTVFRPSTGDWVSLRSLSGMTDYTLRTWGLSSDLPVGRDYDGDGKIDPAVYRPSLGRWLVLQSSTNFTAYVSQDWGLSSDTPVPADYDGDGKADFAVFRPSLGRWVILLSSTGNTSYVLYDWGLSGDIPMPADYDGDGRADLAVFRPSTGQWFILNRFASTYTIADWGVSGDVPVAADFDGDGKADLAVFRPSLGRWFIRSSIDGAYTIADWGLSGDTLVPADYDGDGKADIAVCRPSTGMWYVRGLFNRSWGLSGDIGVLKNP